MNVISHTAPVRNIVFAVVIFGLLVASGCRTESEETVTTRDINDVLEDHATGLMSISGVAAVGIGQLSDGTPCIKIFVTRKTDELMEKLPEKLEGYPVLVAESGEFKPLEDD